MGKLNQHLFWEEKNDCCGVVGVYSKKNKNVAPILYKAMVALQHRGQDAAGIVVWNNGFVQKKGRGLVTNIFKKRDLNIKGKIGIGHTRYPTTGSCLIRDVQPFINKNIAVAHNGQISNYKILKHKLEKQKCKFHSNVDSEIISYLLSEKLKKHATLEQAVKHMMEKCDGAYSITALVKNTLIAFRDPNGIKPFVWGENENFIMFASESVALDINKIPYKGDLRAGEMAIVQNKKIKFKKIINAQLHACMFEYIYFSRPDSNINGKNVIEVRKNLGKELAREHPAKVDIVIEVPDSARTAASTYARELKIPYEEGLIKNRYIGRTFIMRTPKERTDAVRMKLNVVKNIVAGKRVALIDDSIVRGTTLKEIVSLIKNAGAKEVHVRITCPPIVAPCFYGIEMSTYKELAAHTKTIPEIGKMLGADSIGYLSINGLKKAIGLPICAGCLDENYPTPYVKKLLIKQKKTVNK